MEKCFTATYILFTGNIFNKLQAPRWDLLISCCRRYFHGSPWGRSCWVSGFQTDGQSTLPSFLAHLNQKVANNKSLLFLDVPVTRLPNGHFGHSVYRKPNHTDRYLRYSSHYYPAQRHSVISSLVHRGVSLSDTNTLQKALYHIHCTFLNNGFKSRYIKNSIRRYLSQQQLSPKQIYCFLALCWDCY